MKKKIKIVTLLAVLLVASATHLIWTIELADADSISNVNTVDLSNVSYEHIPLTDSEIKAVWPNLPTAKQLYEEGICLIYDSRYSGKRASMNDGLPDPNSPTIIPMSLFVNNYTTSDIRGLKKGITTNSAHIWLQYNNTVWVLVPQTCLKNLQ